MADIENGGTALVKSTDAIAKPTELAVPDENKSSTNMINEEKEEIINSFPPDIQPEFDLERVQWYVMDELVRGRSVLDAATHAGVHRTTIYRWLKHDPLFQAAYNHWQNQTVEGCRARLKLLTEKAMNVVELALSNGSSRVAMQVLKGAGVLRERPAGPTDAEVIRQKSLLKKRKREIRLIDAGDKLMEKEMRMSRGERQGKARRKRLPAG